MGLELILIIMSILVGLNLTLFALKVGIWIFKINLEIKGGLAETPVGKFLYGKRRFSWVTVGLSIGPPLYTWLVRIIGIGLVGGALFILYMVLFF